MTIIHNISDRENEQEHRRNNRNGSTNTRVSGDSNYDNADYDSRHGPGHYGARRGAVDFGRDPRGAPLRRGAEDSGRGTHDDGDDEESESSHRVRRGSAAGRDEFRGFLGAREFERRPVNSRYEEGLEFGRPGRGEEHRPANEEEYRRWQQLRSRADRPRHLERVSNNARVDGEDDFEPRGLRRAAPLTRHGMGERAQYVYYEPHGPRHEADPRSARR